MKWQADILIKGQTHGEVLRLDAPISFWGGISPRSSEVTLASHPQFGVKISHKILVIPEMIGSSSSSAVLLELIYKGIGPRGLILGAGDAILPIGVVIAQQMEWGSIPILKLPSAPFVSGDQLVLEESGQILKISH